VAVRVAPFFTSGFPSSISQVFWGALFVGLFLRKTRPISDDSRGCSPPLLKFRCRNRSPTCLLSAVQILFDDDTFCVYKIKIGNCLTLLSASLGPFANSGACLFCQFLPTPGSSPDIGCTSRAVPIHLKPASPNSLSNACFRIEFPLFVRQTRQSDLLHAR